MVILRIPEYRFFLDAPDDNMLKCAGSIDAGFSRHDPILQFVYFSRMSSTPHRFEKYVRGARRSVLLIFCQE